VGFRVKGGPDIIVLAQAPLTQFFSIAVPIAIELKAKRGKLSDEQIEMSERWEQYGVWITAKSLEDVKAGLIKAGVRIPKEV
jgi:hypothetical protein